MKRIFSDAIITTTILGMTSVPVFAAAGHAPQFRVPTGSAYAQYTDNFDGGRIFLAQNVDGSTEPTGEGNGDQGEGEQEENEPEETGPEENEPEGNQPEETSGNNDSNESDQRFAAVGNSGNARRIILKLEEGENFCRLLDSANRIDCISEVYQSVARSLPNEGDAGVVKQALEKAAVKLDRIVRANLDTSANQIRPKVQTRKVNRTASRPLRAIKKAAIPAANRQAAAVVTELSTVLLRSAGSTKKKNTYYAKIAQAVDSNKVLLRS